MRRGSHLPLLSLLATLVLVGVPPAVGEDQPAWDVTLKPDFQARSTLTVNNRCIRRHTFTVTKENLPFIHFLAETKFSVPAKSSRQLPIQFDTTGMKAGEYEGVVVVTCVSCGNEPTCRQDRDRLPVNLTVTAPPATPAEPATAAPGEPGSRPTSTPSSEPSAAQLAPHRDRLPANLTVTAPPATSAEPATAAPGEPGSRPTSPSSSEPSAAQPAPQPEQGVEVPNLRRLNRKQAQDLLLAAGLQLGRVEEKAAYRWPGAVLKQEPGAGRQVAVGTAVNLVIASIPLLGMASGIAGLLGVLGGGFYLLKWKGTKVLKLAGIEIAASSDLGSQQLETAQSVASGPEVRVRVAMREGDLYLKAEGPVASA